MSEMLNLFAQQAEADGLISLADVKEETPKFEELYPKPKKEFDDLLQQAHPNTIVIAPAYDKVNGIMTNLEQQHRIMVDLAQKPNHGRLTEFLYFKAYQDLNNTLVKTAFMLDRQDQMDLMVLADKSLEQLEKIAFAWIPVLIGVGALLAGTGIVHGIYTSNNPSSQGLKNDLARSIVELNEAIGDYPALGKSLGPLMEKLKDLQSKTDSFIKRNDQIAAAILQVKGATSDEEKKKIIVNNTVNLIGGGKFETIIKEFNAYKDACQSVFQMIPTAIEELNSAEQKHESSDSSWYRSLLGPGGALRFGLDTDAQDAAKQLAVLHKTLSSASINIDKQINTLQELKAHTDLVQSPPKPVETPLETSPTPKEPAKVTHTWL